MTQNYSLMLFLPIFLYAEIHYRFKYFFSFLKKSEPEILADLPHRIEPTASLPILLLIKDAKLYPIEIESIEISFSQKEKNIFSQKILLNEKINSPLWWKIVSILFENELKNIFGFINIDVKFHYQCNGKSKSCINDNYRTSSKKSFCVYRSQNSLPVLPNWIYGDAHTHSSYTNDQVEFGSPLPASVELCKAIGLSFFCATDHSYDLDDKIDNYLVNDSTLPKWNSFQKEVDTINTQEKKFVVIRGEEVSCWNQKQRNVHFLLLGTRKFFTGSGDSAEKWFKTKSEFTIAEILAQKDSFIVAYAAHPTEHTPFFQWLLIKRGEWSLQDMSEKKLDGIQILNGIYNDGFQKGLRNWKKLLLNGKKIFIAGGNDAHGNFNRFKQIGIPFFSIKEKNEQLFGKMRTAMKISNVNEENILSCFRNGNTVITNGPLCIFEIHNEDNTIARIGETITGKKFTFHLNGISTQEYGEFSHINIYCGNLSTKKEVLWKNYSNINSFSFHHIETYLPETTYSYLRIESFTKNGDGWDKFGFCYTNPIWIEDKT